MTKTFTELSQSNRDYDNERFKKAKYEVETKTADARFFQDEW